MISFELSPPPICQVPAGGGIIKRMNEETNISNNTEIDQALKEFEAKSDIKQNQQASESSKSSPAPQNEVEGVKFDVPSYGYGAVKYYSETNTPKVVKLVMKFSGGMIKNEKQAEYALLVFVILAMAVSFYLFFGGRGNTPSVNVEDPSLLLPEN